MHTKTKKLLSTLLALALALSLFVAMPIKASAAATETESNSCEINGVKYSLVGALAAVPQGGTSPTVVKLLTNIVATGPTLDFNNRKITFDLNGWELQFTQLFIRGGSMINYAGTGHFIASWKVTNGSASSGYSPLMISDNSSCTLTGVRGTIAPEGIARLIECESGSRVTVNGDVQGSAKSGAAVIAGNGSTVTINGNITMDAAFTGIGANAYINSKVIVNGNINVPAGTGARASNNSTVTVEGRITAQTYASLMKTNGTFVDKSINDYAADTTKSGYRTYAEGDSTVWVKEPTPPATITQQPVSRSIDAGQSTTFSVVASNAISYQWQQLLPSGGMFSAWINIPDGGIYTGATTATLNLTNVPAEYNSTKYRCIVKGSFGNVTSNEATLTITGAISTPVIDTQPENRSITAGQSVSFTVAATGALSYQWQEARATGGPLVAWTNLSNSGIYSGVTSATLSLSNVPIDYNNTKYRCIVRGTAGSVTSSEATLTVTEATTPPTITGPTTMLLPAGYPATSTTVFTITGTPDPNVSKTSGHASITWNDSTKKLDIAAGLAAGNYPVVLTAISGTNTATFTFTLTVTAAPSTGGSMDNFNPPVNNYTPGMFTDVDENAWYGFNQQGVIANAYNYGLMTGTSATTFHPMGNMSVAEAITVAARVHSIYMTGAAVFVTGSPWYQVYVDYAISKDIIKATDFTNYTRSVTRAEMAYIFSRCLPAAELPAQNTVNSLPDVNNSTPYKDEIFMLYKAGVVQGSGTPGTFYPNNNIIRAEAAAIISRVILPLTRFSGRTFG